MVFVKALQPQEQLAIYSTGAFLLSLISTISLVPFVNKIGLKYNIIDIPDNRKTHKKKIVRLGGLGMIIGGSISLLTTYLISKENYFEIEVTTILTIIGGSFLFFLIGLFDDIREVKPVTKLNLQIIISSILFFQGIRFNAIEMNWLNANLNPIAIHPVISYILCIGIIAGLTNSFNWLDGLDGLASGIATIIYVGLFIIFISMEKYDLALITSSMCGTTIAFLRYNFYPAKILMGDGGSYMLGSSLAIISIIGLGKESVMSNLEINTYANMKIMPIHLLIILFLLPVIDMLYVIITRILDGYSPFYPDRRHIHHRILDRGLPHRYTVIVLYAISQNAVSFSMYLSDVEGKIVYMCMSVIFIVLSAIYCINMKKHLDSSYIKD